MNTISVIVPTYNQAEFLAPCLDSIWFQEHPSLEIIVVNDGCTDDTAAVLDQYQQDIAQDSRSFASRFNERDDIIEREHHPRYPQHGRTLRIITHEKNKGLAPALNTGFRAATGEYCTYVPSDDVCYPTMFTEMVQAMERENADFVYADMLITDAQGRVVRRFSLPEYSFTRCFGDWYLCGVAKLYKTSLHKEVGYYDESLLAHDHELFMRFAMAGAGFFHVPKALMGVREHEGAREVEIHAPENWRRLLNESKKLVLEARAHPLYKAENEGGDAV